MDKNTGIGLMLIMLILGGYMYFSNKNNPQQNEQKQPTEIVDNAKQIKQPDKNNHKINTKDYAIAVESMGESLASQLLGEVEYKTIENDDLIIRFSNKGGYISSVEFKGYKSYDDFKSEKDQSMVFFAPEDSKFGIKFFSKSSDIETSDFYFKNDGVPSNVTGDSVTVPYRLYADSVSYVEFLYTIYKSGFKIDFDIRFVNMKGYIDERSANIDLNWSLNFKQKEKGFSNENNYTTIAYKYPGENSIEELSAGSDEKSEDVPTKIEWVNFKQHFFSAILVTNGSVNNKMSYTAYPDTNPEKYLKTCNANVQLSYAADMKSIPLEFYFVPNHFRTLKSYSHSFEKIVPLGGSIIGLINRGVVIPVFDFLKNYIVSFGLIIFMLTLLIKLIISPLTWKSYLSSAKMKVLRPEVDKIGAKYPDPKDAMKKQQEVMALYKRTGVSMLGGCLPMLLQMPIFYALFRFFPSSFELRQESFLWADDLSAYDSILDLPFSVPFVGSHISLFTLLMAVSMFISTKISMSRQGGAMNDQMKMMNKSMLYVMPVMMFVLFNKFSSGLTYYYFLSNVITIVQTTIISKYFVNEEKLLKQLNERAAKQPKTPAKGGFMDRLMKTQEEMQRRQQQKERDQKNNRRLK